MNMEKNKAINIMNNLMNTILPLLFFLLDIFSIFALGTEKMINIILFTIFVVIYVILNVPVSTNN